MIRRANPADIPEMMAIRVAVTQNRLLNLAAVPAESYSAYLNERGRGWVAVVDGAVVGFSFADRRGEIWALFLRRSYEGRGIGRALLDEAVRWLARGGHATVRLTTEPGTRAESLYRRAGWIREGEASNGDASYRLDLPVNE